MTCVVALNHEGRIYFGSDSAASDGETIDVVSKPKFIEKPDIIIGFCGSFRVAQIIEYYFPFGNKAKKTEKWLHTKFIETLRNLLDKHGARDFQGGDLLSNGSGLLVSINQKIYEVQQDFSIAHYDRGYAAIGSGASMALASLHSTEGLIEPEERLLRALRAAGAFSVGCAPPYHIIERG